MEDIIRKKEEKKEYSLPEMEILILDKSEGIICASCCDGYTDYGG